MAGTNETLHKLRPLIVRGLGNHHLWIVAAIIALLTAVHYHELFPDVWGLKQIGSILGLGLARHTLERILFLVPVAYAAAMLGVGGGVSTLILVTVAMLPRVFLLSTEPREALFETAGVVLTGALLVSLLYALQRGKQQLIELERTQKQLSRQIQRLGMLHIVSSVVSRSLEPDECLTAMDRVGQLMETDATWLYLWNDEQQKLELAACNGMSGTALPQAPGPGQWPDSVVADSKRPVLSQDLSTDPAAGAAPLSKEGLQSALVVPLIAKGGIRGTLGVATRSAHQFSQDEIDLLTAVADQVAVAVENAYLYERERLAAEALRVSERNYRELFEKASDAIWVHDFNGKILAANSAFAKLTGYEQGELVGANINLFLPRDQNWVENKAHQRVLRGEAVEPFEQELVKKDHSTVIVNVGTSLIAKDEEPWAFQHIARDVTEEKRVQENLRFYVRQVSQAQEAERKRIAQELHDDTAQALVVVARNLDDIAAGRSRMSVKDVREQVRGVLQGVRRFSQQLRPSILDDLGLVPALKKLATDLTNTSSIDAHVEVGDDQHQLPPETELVLYRIVQEALTNVRKHSQADTVRVKVEFEERSIRITIIDNGKGFQVPERVGDLARVGKLGLAGMHERAELLGGTLTLDTEPGKGTIIVIEVPVMERTNSQPKETA